MTGVRPADRQRYETSPRRNSTRISPLHAAQLHSTCVYCGFGGRIGRVPSPGDLATHVHRSHLHSRALLFLRRAPLSATGGNNVRDSREPREPDRGAGFLPATRHSAVGDMEMVRAKIDRARSRLGIFILCSETANFFM